MWLQSSCTFLDAGLYLPLVMTAVSLHLGTMPWPGPCFVHPSSLALAPQNKPQVLDLDHGKDKPFLGVAESHLPEPLRPKEDGRDFLNPVQSKREKIRHRFNVYRTEQNVTEQNRTQWTLPSLWWKTLFKPRSRTILANSKLKDLATPSFLCFVHSPSGQRWVIPGALLGR